MYLEGGDFPHHKVDFPSLEFLLLYIHLNMTDFPPPKEPPINNPLTRLLAVTGAAKSLCRW